MATVTVRTGVFAVSLRVWETLWRAVGVWRVCDGSKQSAWLARGGAKLTAALQQWAVALREETWPWCTAREPGACGHWAAHAWAGRPQGRAAASKAQRSQCKAPAVRRA